MSDREKVINDLQRQVEELEERLAIVLEGKEQDYRGWLMDMFHKYGRDDLIALLVLRGEENLLADVLKKQELIEEFVEIDEVEEPRKAKVETEGDLSWWFACGECQMQISKGDKYCRQCGRELDWSGIYLKAAGAERVFDDLRSEGAEREQEPGEP